MAFRLPFLILLVGVAACDPSSSSRDVTVRDSAGVRIVENHKPTRQGDEGVAVAPAPSLVIGAPDGPPEQQLYQVQDATVLPDGNLAVLNSGASELRFYSPDGEHVKTVGREGEGPGEFRTPEWLAVVVDTLMVYDPFQGNGRLSLFEMTGEFIRSERVEVEGDPFPSPEFTLPDGGYLEQRTEGSISWEQEGHVVSEHRTWAGKTLVNGCFSCG